MKINYLKVHNIGPYVGEHTFNLDTNSSNNIILIGGKNGAGKTTFLKSIKYGLFGCFALGLKTETDKYYKEIKALINNKAKGNCYIEISFDYIENFEVKKYLLKRSWIKKDSNISEELTIISDGYLLDTFETKEVSDKLRALTSPHLINSFIFDGEKISSIIEDGQISTYLEETFNSIFNVDLIKQTMTDLENYLSKKADESNVKSQIENVTLLSRINSTKSQIKSFESELNELKSSLINLKSIRKANNDNFYKLGGLTKAEQEKYNKQIESYNSRKEEMNKKVRMFIETDLPLYMNRDLLLDAFMQNRLERQAKYPSYISEIEMFLGIDLSSVKTQLKEKVVDCEIIQGMDENEGEFCHKRHDDALLSYANVKSYVDDKLNKTDEYRLMKKLVLDNENIETINNIIEENKKIDVSILEIERSQEELNSKISSLNSELEMLYAMYERTNDELKKSSLYDSSFILGKSTLDICMKLANVITKNKLKTVSDKALGIFNDTIRKNGFITKLEITPEFNLVLYNGQGTMIDPKTLSAGEMQIMVSSLIWAMFRVSGRREMFIFDTPLARLDEDNRYKFIAKIISTISSQVVILSTDSEFVGKNLEIIKDRIHIKYLLDYDEKTAKTTVTEDYFGGELV